MFRLNMGSPLLMLCLEGVWHECLKRKDVKYEHFRPDYTGADQKGFAAA